MAALVRRLSQSGGQKPLQVTGESLFEEDFRDISTDIILTRRPAAALAVSEVAPPLLPDRPWAASHPPMSSMGGERVRLPPDGCFACL